VVYIGTNGKMTEVAAAMGLSSLESMEKVVDTNRSNYKLYLEELSGILGIRAMRYDDTEACNYQYVVLEIDDQEAGIDRDRLLRVLHAEKVIARRYFYPGCHRMEPYHSFFPDAGLQLPHTERLARQVMSLPTGTAVGEEEIRGICGLLRFAVGHGAEIKGRMSRLG
jgi:dTDP-4-amino-4,6-dideoxygalactose transaminase